MGGCLILISWMCFSHPSLLRHCDFSPSLRGSLSDRRNLMILTPHMSLLRSVIFRIGWMFLVSLAKTYPTSLGKSCNFSPSLRGSLSDRRNLMMCSTNIREIASLIYISTELNVSIFRSQRRTHRHCDFSPSLRRSRQGGRLTQSHDVTPQMKASL